MCGVGRVGPLSNAKSCFDESSTTKMWFTAYKKLMSAISVKKFGWRKFVTSSAGEPSEKRLRRSDDAGAREMNFHSYFPKQTSGQASLIDAISQPNGKKDLNWNQFWSWRQCESKLLIGPSRVALDLIDFEWLCAVDFESEARCLSTERQAGNNKTRVETERNLKYNVGHRADCLPLFCLD